MPTLERLGLGCMGMSCRRNPEASIKTIHAALDRGITLFNTGEFYNAGESEMIVGQAMRGVPRDRYFLSVKFGVLPQPGGGIYGLDNKPFNVKGHLAYSLARLGMDYVDLYQPARQDTEIPVEEVVGEIARLVEAGYVRHIGLSMVDAETLRRACKVHPIHTVEMSYSLIDRDIERELIGTAKELGVRVLAFGTIGHGLFADNVLERSQNDPRLSRGLLSPEHRETNLPMIKAVKTIADEKGIGLSQLALAWSLAKYNHMQSLVGTTDPAHLKSAVDALSVTLSKADIERIEAAIPADAVRGKGMRNFRFTNGQMSLAT
ncbi:MAG: aldo/keto reductase [Clostridia bacterium]|nr:aldo/keto reductase [Clostridia bacterium]